MISLSLRRISSTSSSSSRWTSVAARRFLSSGTSTAPSAPSTPPPASVQPPSQVTDEMALGIQDSTSLYVKYGLAKQRLETIRSDKDSSIVTRWQQMMEAFLGTQVHVLAGLGYTPDEKGLGLYNAQLAQFVQSASPELQEKLRIQGRDTWRTVLSMAFDVDLDNIQELSIVDARNMMHKVSMKMQEGDILEAVARQCALVKPSEDQPQMEMALKHQVIQEVLVNQVYLGGESPNTLVEECGFKPGVEGYVYMQCVMAEHQTDPLVAQYIGSAITKIMEAAGLDMASIQKAAQQNMEK